MNTKDEYIQKLESIYQILKKYIIATSLSDKDWGEMKALESELSSLKAEMEKEDNSDNQTICKNVRSLN